jgi:hypothetical protein
MDCEDFSICSEAREEFFESEGQPCACPGCQKEYAVEEGRVSYRIADTPDPYRIGQYVRHRGAVLFLITIWPSPEDFPSIFRLEDLAEKVDGSYVPLEDLTASLADSDLELFEGLLDTVMTCRSMVSIGDAFLMDNPMISLTLRLDIEGSRLWYHELCRRIFAFYEPGLVIRPDDNRFYRLIWKVMQRIYKRDLGRTRRAFEGIAGFGFLNSVRDWVAENYPHGIRLTPVQVRVMRAIIEHFAFESMKPTEEAEVGT